jgi:hypothetical protein
MTSNWGGYVPSQPHTVGSHYQRAEDEGRTLIQSALATGADPEVTENELRVTLAPQSSPHRTRAMAGCVRA